MSPDPTGFTDWTLGNGAVVVLPKRVVRELEEAQNRVLLIRAA